MAGVQSQGTSFTFNAATVGNIKSYSGFDGASEEIDVTVLSSTAKEYEIGLEDFGNLTLEINADESDAGLAALRTAKTAATSHACVLTLSDNSTASFNAFVVSISNSGETSGVDTASVNLRITGAVTWA